MQAISLNEKKAIDEVMTLGYHRAARSFASLTGQRVKVGKTFIELCPDRDNIMAHCPSQQDVTVLRTDVMGQLGGSSYLVFDREERETIPGMSWEVFGRPGTFDPEAVLKEIDNILAAAVITQLSNVLDIAIYGDVPQLIHLAHIKDLQALHGPCDRGNCLMAYTHFVFEGKVRLSPYFAWEVDKRIIGLVKV